MSRATWHYYWSFFRGLQLPLLFSVILAIILSLAVLPIAFLLSRIFDHIIPAGDIRALIQTGALVILLSAGSAGLSLWTRHRTLHITKTAVERLRDELLKQIYSFSRIEYTKADLGKLHSFVVHDTERVDYMSNVLFTQLLPAIAVACSLSAVLIAVNWSLFVVLVAITPPLYWVGKSLRKNIDRYARVFRESFTRFSAGVYFVLQTLDLSHIQTAEQFELQRQRGNLERLRSAGHSMAWSFAAYNIIYTAFANSSGFLVLIFGGIAIIRNAMTLGELLSFYIVMSILKTNLNQISYSIPHVTGGSQSMTAVHQFHVQERPAPYHGTRQIAFSGRLRLDGLSFQYEGKPLLKELNLEIDSGSTVAIVGPNGAGKSTIVNLILGFYRPQSGSLYADDHDYLELDLLHFRRQLGVAVQQTVVFPGTILNNITYGHPDAEQDEVIRAARTSTAHDFIDLLPNGYQTNTGEGGALLSGGQRQRLALARALLRRPKLLILDEPTAHLDPDTVDLLMKNLKAVDPAPTILIITHDLEIVRDVDRLFLLENGSLVPLVGART
jgi:ATP-binding cassette subfamily B protein